VAKSGAREFCAEKTISGEEKLFMPGLIDSHMHTGQQLLKGLVLDAKPIIWTRVMLPFESTLTPEKMKLSAQAAALEMIKSGTTAFIDAGSYYMDAAAEVYEKSGLRGCLSYSTMDEDGLPESIAMDAAQAVTETDRLYDGWNGKGNLKVYYSLRALNSCSHELTELAAGHARERGAMLQAHMNEYQGEVDGIIKRENMRPYEFLEKMGVLSDRFLGAHSLILSETEKELIKKRGVKLCHCPFSNCGKAVPDTPDLAERGIIPGFGTDGAAHGGLSLWNEMRIFRSLMNIYHGVPNRNPKVMPAELLFRMLWEGGAAAVDEAGQCGKIAEGCKADFVSIYLDAGRLIPSGNLLHTMFECAESGDVRDMVVGGKVLMENREVQTLDEEKIRFEMKEYMKRM
jgi:5-methylthioadenosine/S-adenosylhomocysteine deaminase